MKQTKNYWLIGTLVIWFFTLLWSGHDPKDRLTWWMEVMPALLAAPVLWGTQRKFPFPNYIYFWICIHGLVLIVGGHYTYAHVPIGDWFKETFDLSRNHYDRLGHLMQGFVPALIAREILVRKVGLKSRGWVVFLTITVCMSISAFYEFIEWWSALIYGAQAEDFLSHQGDEWDTQWDMLLATVGALVALSIYPKLPQGNAKK